MTMLKVVGKVRFLCITDMGFHIQRTCYAQFNAVRVNFWTHLIALCDPIRLDIGIFDFLKRAVEKFLTIYGVCFPKCRVLGPETLVSTLVQNV